MDIVVEGIAEAIQLVLSLDPETLRITWLSLQVSLAATALSLVVGIPAGSFLALARFRFRGTSIALVNTGMGVPPVVVGLFVGVMLWRTGPLGALGILYTPWAIVVAQFLIAAPIVSGITLAAIGQLDPEMRAQLQAMGASRIQVMTTLLKEARIPLLAAVMAGFGGVISEVGASMMVGGNILGQTRVLTTATVMETSRGNFGTAIALSLILLTLTLTINWVLTPVQQGQVFRREPSRFGPRASRGGHVSAQSGDRGSRGERGYDPGAFRSQRRGENDAVTEYWAAGER